MHFTSPDIRGMGGSPMFVPYAAQSSHRRKNAALLLMSVEYDRRLLSTTSHGLEAHAT
jgi:hypothetical protein